MLQSRIGETIDQIVNEYRGRRGVLLQVFHRIQEAFGYVPPEAMEPIAAAFRIPPSTLFGTLTFYSEFRTEPPARVQVGMCLGPTCHIKGAEVVKQILEYRLGLSGEHDASLDVAIHEVECAGHCHLAPLVYVNGMPEGPVEVSAAQQLADRILSQVSA
ncbi:MAG: hypothetical protein EXR52_01215 [Dehalococcoidia bacterium]|nr:hypothetical protein [Dehalococcoidia bacterium]